MQMEFLAEGDGMANGSLQRGSKGYVSHGELMVTMCLIHILIARIKSNIHKFRHANEQEGELDFSLPVKFSNVEEKQTELC